jgi:hypothetical protein
MVTNKTKVLRILTQAGGVVSATTPPPPAAQPTSPGPPNLWHHKSGSAMAQSVKVYSSPT